MSGPNILLVDDSKFDRKMLRRALDRSEIEVGRVDEAEHAFDAVDRINETLYDAVFLDINMPGVTGFAFLRALRAAYPGTWPMVFMLSSSTHLGDVETAFAEHANGYFVKPENLTRLQAVVEAVLTTATGTPTRPGIAADRRKVTLQ